MPYRPAACRDYRADALTLSNFYADLTAEETHAAQWVLWYEMVVKRGVDPYTASTAVATASFGFVHPSDASTRAPCLLRAAAADALARCLALRAQPHLQLGVRAARLSPRPGGVAVQTSGGRTLFAERLVVTVPAGVLAAERGLFEPPLPAPKTDVLARLRQADILHGHVTSPGFLPSALADATLAYTSAVDTEVASLGEWLFRAATPIGSPPCAAIFFSVSGKIAKRLEVAPAAEVRGTLEAVFARMLGAEAAAAALGSAAWETLVLSSWSSSPLSRGATVMPPVGLSPSMITRLRAPEWNGTVFFAGDAMELAGFGTAAAALSSARTATFRLLQATADAELLGSAATSDALQSCGEVCIKCAQ